MFKASYSFSVKKIIQKLDAFFIHEYVRKLLKPIQQKITLKKKTNQLITKSFRPNTGTL